MDNGLTTSLTDIAGFGTLQTVQGLWYNKTDISIDGYKFSNCRFDSCRIFVNTTRFELFNCFLSQDTSIIYGPELIKVVKLWNSRNELIIRDFPVFAPAKNADGTISIIGTHQ